MNVWWYDLQKEFWWCLYRMNVWWYDLQKKFWWCLYWNLRKLAAFFQKKYNQTIWKYWHNGWEE